jgi:hypothetical protein
LQRAVICPSIIDNQSREVLPEAEPIKNVEYYRGPWRRDPAEPRYIGLTAAQFDIAILGAIILAALAVWLFIFNGETTARDYLGLEKSLSGGVSQQPAPSAAEQPATSADQPAPAEQPAPAAAAPPAEPTINDFLVSSAQALDGVQSFRARFQMTMRMNGESVNSGGDMVFQAPNKMHMTMNADGQTFEMLARLPTMYIRIPHEGWYAFDGEAMGFSPQALSDYMNNRGLFDAEAEARLLRGIVQLPDEQIDGVAYDHFQGTLDAKNLFQAVGPDLIDSSAADLRSVSGPVNVDLLLDKDTHLPRRHTVTMDLDFNGTPISMDLRMAFLEFNGSVSVPDAPEDARPFNSLATGNPPSQTD